MGRAEVQLYLTRHGETDGHSMPLYEGDPPLTEVGHEQARLLADALKDQGIQVIISSGMRRAKETASPLSEILDLPVVPLSGLNEMELGSFPGNDVVGRTRDMSEFAEWGGESATGFSKRVSMAFDSLIAGFNKDAEKAALFLHHGVLNAILDSMQGIASDGNNRTLFFNASITVVKFESGRWVIESINDTSHLPKSLLTPSGYIEASH